MTSTIATTTIVAHECYNTFSEVIRTPKILGTFFCTPLILLESTTLNLARPILEHKFSVPATPLTVRVMDHGTLQ